MSEVDLMRRIQVVLSTVGARTFRNNVGLGWIGDSLRFTRTGTVRVEAGDVLIKNARPLHAGLIKDSADLIGFSTETGKFISCEVKMPGEKPTPKQYDWLCAVKNAGGIAFWADSIESAIINYKRESAS